MVYIYTVKDKIEFYYKNSNINDVDKQEVLRYTREVVRWLNNGEIRVLDNLWVKKAILLMFKFTDCKYDCEFDSYDKADLLKYDETTKRYRKVPGAIIRNGVYIGNGCIIMPSYINIGAYIDDNTMIDINSCIGSCAQIGKNCHISANSTIGGVLEPVSANPVIIEDGCFVGANSAVLEGAIVKRGAVISAGTIISSSTKIIDRETQEILPHGIVPEYSVVVPGNYPSKNGFNINCAVVVKKSDKKTAKKVKLNSFLRKRS
ncbi:MAG: 2,3,4,5-tetrahydropyridine-2,6-dicarboxylate N-succinyltransferase [Holosporales bacterium]|jgi:2,3,4,5-tetrahydropyridine-2-carboxylate N-succinyltransferase|nr:2,3,4,5-tetrahydropyridine-2,6-dicarboxylate N-succinyltransferase [Holosporales bacterium]